MMEDFHDAEAEILIVVPEEFEKAGRYAGAMSFGGVVVPDKTKQIYRRYGLDRSWLGVIQKSEVFVIDESGTIRFAQGHGLPTSLPSVTEVLGVVRSLQSGSN